MRALFALLAWLCVAGAAVAQMPPGAYGPGPCPFGASSCQVTATAAGQTTTQTLATLNVWWATTLVPDWLAAGPTSNGTEANPYTYSDGTAGVQTQINALQGTALAPLRGGTITLTSSHYNFTSAAKILGPSINVVGATRGFNVDPNGEAAGSHGSMISATAGCFSVGPGTPIPNARIQGVLFRNLYCYGSNKTNGSAGISIQHGTDQPKFENVAMSGFNYGLDVEDGFDGANISNFTAINNGTGINFGNSFGSQYSKVVDSDVPDNDNFGITSIDAVGQERIINNTLLRNGRVLTAHGSNVYLTSPFNLIALNAIEDAGHNTNTSTNVTAQGMILAGNNNVSGLNYVRANKNGYGIDITGNNNQSLNDAFYQNGAGGNGPDVRIESGATDNTVIALGPTNLVDLGTTSRLFYQLGTGTTGGGTTGNGGNAGEFRLQSVGLPALHIIGTGHAYYGTYMDLDGVTLGGHNWRFGATGTNAGEGPGKLLIQDVTASGATRMTIDTTGQVGIGTTSPGALLEVNGTTKTDGVLTPAGGVAAAGGFTLSPRTIGTCEGAANVAYTSQTPVATEFYVVEVRVPANVTVTGVALYNSATISGNVKVGLANSSGVNVATSASTAMAGTTAYQLVPFTGTYAAVGPATYYVEVFYDNATARPNTITAGACGVTKATGQVFATGFTTIAAPTTFTTALGPVATLY